MKAKLPKDVYESLVIIAESLPLSPARSVLPFHWDGVLTSQYPRTGHRDTMDLLFCAVFALGGMGRRSSVFA